MGYLFWSSTLITLGIILYLEFQYNIVNIRNNWSEYRCNPIYMPLSDNIEADFTYCVQNTQINLMGYLLQPLTYLI